MPEEVCSYCGQSAAMFDHESCRETNPLPGPAIQDNPKKLKEAARRWRERFDDNSGLSSISGGR